MKHINSLTICVIISLEIMQAQNYTCTGYSGGIVYLSGDSATINLCAEDYNASVVGDDPHTMSVNLSPGKRYSITGRVELEQVQYSDFITLREEDAAGNTISILASYWGCTIDDIHLITKNTTGRIRVDIYCFYGATAATSGFEFTIVPATTETIEVGHVLGALGIGTSTPQKELHVVGDVRVSSNNGNWMQLSSSNRYPLFSTNAEMFDFNKPVRSDGFASPRYSDLVFSTYDTPRVTIDDTTGYVGIGTTNPQEKLDIRGMLRIQTDGGWVKLGPMNWGFMHFFTDRPKFYFNKPISVQDGIISSIERVDLQLQTFNTTHLRIQYGTGNVGIGKPNPIYKLDVAGEIHADSVRSAVIKSGAVFVESVYGADYVFDNSYNLRPLQEVSSYIQENGHLPEIQSAEEMQQNGINMSEFQIQLLQKIEELTLYIIHQEERIKDLEQRHPKK